MLVLKLTESGAIACTEVLNRGTAAFTGQFAAHNLEMRVIIVSSLELTQIQQSMQWQTQSVQKMHYTFLRQCSGLVPDTAAPRWELCREPIKMSSGRAKSWSTLDQEHCCYRGLETMSTGSTCDV